MTKFFYSRDCEKAPGSVAELYDIFLKLRGGDTLEIPSVDHLCDRWHDLHAILGCLEGTGVTLSVQHTVGKRGAPPEVGFKRDLRRAAAQRARAAGAYANNKGRPQKADAARVRQLSAAGTSIDTIAFMCGVAPITIRRYLRSTNRAA